MSTIGTILAALTLTTSEAEAAAPAAYTATCESCHGPEGKGNGVAAQALNPKPADLSMSNLNDADLDKVINGGGPAIGKSPTMPPMGAALSAAQKAEIVAYLKSLR